VASVPPILIIDLALCRLAHISIAEALAQPSTAGPKS
jgi:hypothetical protein